MHDNVRVRTGDDAVGPLGQMCAVNHVWPIRKLTPPIHHQLTTNYRTRCRCNRQKPSLGGTLPTSLQSTSDSVVLYPIELINWEMVSDNFLIFSKSEMRTAFIFARKKTPAHTAHVLGDVTSRPIESITSRCNLDTPWTLSGKRGLQVSSPVAINRQFLCYCFVAFSFSCPALHLEVKPVYSEVTRR